MVQHAIVFASFHFKGLWNACINITDYNYLVHMWSCLALLPTLRFSLPVIRPHVPLVEAGFRGFTFTTSWNTPEAQKRFTNDNQGFCHAGAEKWCSCCTMHVALCACVPRLRRQNQPRPFHLPSPHSTFFILPWCSPCCLTWHLTGFKRDLCQG